MNACGSLGRGHLGLPLNTCQRQSEIPLLRCFASIAITKKYLLTYPDGSRKHIDREERDSLLLSGSAKQTQPLKYLYIGPVHTFHSFADLSRLTIAAPSECRRFLQGNFIIEEPGGRKITERLETVGGMTARLIKQGVLELAN